MAVSAAALFTDVDDPPEDEKRNVRNTLAHNFYTLVKRFLLVQNNYLTINNNFYHAIYVKHLVFTITI